MTTTTRASRPAGHAHHYNAAQQAHDDFLSIHLSPSTARDLQDRRGARTTLSHFDDSSDEDEYEDEEEMHTPTTSSHSHIPLHPIESMQEAFAESLEEATRSGVSLKPKLKAQDAKARREKLLDEDKSQGPPNRLWRFRPGQKCHELRKLIAQIAFGIELLMKGMANSNAQVLSILQGHIDEVDEFLETTMDDVNEAIKDLKERLDFLKVPMLNIEVFEQMLEKRKFRAQILEGNAKIEHILSRTSTAHTQTIRDISEGVRAIQQFSEYLTDHEHKSWRRERPDVIDVFDAMKGNTEGWYNAFTTLEANSTLLSGLLVQLSTMVVDINKKAAEISRRTRVSQAGPVGFGLQFEMSLFVLTSHSSLWNRVLVQTCAPILDLREALPKPRRRHPRHHQKPTLLRASGRYASTTPSPHSSRAQRVLRSGSPHRGQNRG